MLPITGIKFIVINGTGTVALVPFRKSMLMKLLFFDKVLY